MVKTRYLTAGKFAVNTARLCVEFNTQRAARTVTSFLYPLAQVFFNQMYVLLKIITYASLDYNLPGGCNHRSYLWIWWNCGGCCWNSKSPVLPVFDIIRNLSYNRNGPTTLVARDPLNQGPSW